VDEKTSFIVVVKVDRHSAPTDGEDEMHRLLQVETEMDKVVVGPARSRLCFVQGAAPFAGLTSKIRAGLSARLRCSGPTGVGKTLLARRSRNSCSRLQGAHSSWT